MLRPHVILQVREIGSSVGALRGCAPVGSFTSVGELVHAQVGGLLEAAVAEPAHILVFGGSCELHLPRATQLPSVLAILMTAQLEV